MPDLRGAIRGHWTIKTVKKILMKKFLLGLALLFTFSTFTVAQSGADDLKNASKLLSKYNKDPFANGESLTEAIGLLTSAFEDESVKNNAQSWVTRGEIYKSLAADSQSKNKLLDPNFEITQPLAAVHAFESYMKADELAQSADSKTVKKVSKSVLSGVKEIEELLNNYGIGSYQLDDYEDALTNFQAELKAYDFLKGKGEQSRLEGEGMLYDKQFFTAISASLIKNYDVAIPLLENLVAGDTEEAVVYQFLFEGYTVREEEGKAGEILKKGRELFPDDNNLLFAEINFYLEKGELQKIVANLKSALEMEPENVSVVTTLGQVYDQLAVASDKDGDIEKSNQYFSEAEKYYSNALDKNADNFDLNYNLGALYYNKAATFTDDLNAMADDFTPSGVKKYDAIKAQMAGFFDKALPYFLKADTLNGKDRNTLIALKEITARKDDFTGSEGYKVRLEALEE